MSFVSSPQRLSSLGCIGFILACGTLLASGPVSVGIALAQTSVDSSGNSFAAQPGESAVPPGIRGQDEKDRTLELAPQKGIVPPDKGVEVVPSEKAYKPGEDTASLNRNFNPGGEDTGGTGKQHGLPYIGISVNYTLKCYLGAEVHGLEIVKVDPNSPAFNSGLKGSKPMTAIGKVGIAAGALLGPLNLAVTPLLTRAGQLGTDGDLIVAVNDHRVRSELDLEDELAKLKPGDTMYLTVLRPLPGNAHQEMKIAIKVGEPAETAEAKSANVAGPSASDAEEYAY